MRQPSSKRFLTSIAGAVMVVAVGGLAGWGAYAESAPSIIARQPVGATVIPGKFLRRWDPVTIFFDRDIVRGSMPNGSQPEHNPGKYVTFEPAHPGAFTWLNGRTLQFQPAEPWPALGRTTWHVGAKSGTLVSLMDAALSSLPADGATGLNDVETLTLEFAQPVDPKALAQMLDIEVAPLPGIDRAQARRIDPADYAIKPVERIDRHDHAAYIVSFRQPIPAGMRVTVTLGLSTESDLNGTVQRIGFSTAETFRPLSLGCGDAKLPIAADGSVYDKTAALTCKAEIIPAATTDSATQHTDNANGDDTSANSDESAASPPDNASNGAGAADQSDGQSGGQSGDSGKPPAPPPLHAALKREIVVQFSAPLAAIDPVAMRNLVRITPHADGVKSSVVGDQLHVSAQFNPGTLYQIALEPTALKDKRGRDLVMPGRSAGYVSWSPETPFLNLAYGSGIVERYGPQMVPLRGRAYQSADVRIHAINPLDRSFWPFPHDAVTQDEDVRPPSPGEVATPYTSGVTPTADQLVSQIQRLGTPSISELMTLPLTQFGASARFGLDLAPAFARVAGKQRPGTYLVGIRRLDKSHQRDWMRVQVTDLSLTTVEEEQQVRFVVTSLATGKPVEGAEISVEGDGPHDAWQSITHGTTAADGHFTWTHDDAAKNVAIGRIAVIKGDDVLVVDPANPPDRYSVSGWYPGSNAWLSWMQSDTADRHPKPQKLCHIFTERPIYRPTDPVHIKAYVRTLTDGALLAGKDDEDARLIVSGPDNAEWTYKLDLDATGNAHFLFDEKTDATGLYQARIEFSKHRGDKSEGDNQESIWQRCGSVTFKKDAYRLPKFQVRLDASKSIPLDKPATVGMTATYYAGGAANDRPVRWRVTQFPYEFKPDARDGFLYATDARYQSGVLFQGAAERQSTGKTDAEGRASLVLDPTREKTSQARRYVVEATVIGDDDKTVTNTETVLALPAFVIGLKAPRYIDHATTIPVEYLIVDGNGKPVAGHPVTVRLLKRQWSSILQASDFTDGKPKYRTDIVDRKQMEKTVLSGSDAVKLDLPITESGVYIVEIEAADDLGRRQTVSVDLFAGGNEPVTWSRPPAKVFKVTTDKPKYNPGDTANLVLESPFQQAQALAIVEKPDGSNDYRWVDVHNGYGKLTLLVDKTEMPRLPVHFALMRGRLKAADDSGDSKGGVLDLRRPQTLAATAWVSVTPVDNIVTMKIDTPAAAQPGDTVDMTVHLSDRNGRPIGGEGTFWLIDQAVLALAQEAPLNPLPHFIRDRKSHVSFSDTRNSVFGSLALDEDPGGDVGAGDQALLNKVTIRKNFNPVPYYNPALMVDSSGAATVTIKLPDNLTNFMIRAEAASGTDRFGFATGKIAVHLPVIVEPNLPRFARPGDQFTLSAIGRVVEGAGGPGRGEAKVDGLTVAGPLVSQFDWIPGKPTHFNFPVTVPPLQYGADGLPTRTTAQVTLGVERAADKARDAFSVALPIEPDRNPVRRRAMLDVTGAAPVTLPAIDQPIRPGTLQRTLLLSTEPGIVRLAGALSYLREYPFGCTEQRLSLARAEIAAHQFAAALTGDPSANHVERSVKETLAWIATVTDPSGQVAFYPGMEGEVLLTAWSVDFMMEAQKAGYVVDPTELATLKQALERALRSDYSRFVSGSAYTERAWALSALARAGALDDGYAAELTRKTDYLSVEALAQVRLALGTSPSADPQSLARLDRAIWNGIVIKQRDGQPVYGGLQDRWIGGPMILESETRTLAEALRAVSKTSDPRNALLTKALVTLGQGDGWGSTNANAEAMLALTNMLTGHASSPSQAVTVSAGNAAAQTVTVGGDHPLQRMALTSPDKITVQAPNATAKNTVIAESTATYVPVEDGGKVTPASAGFVVERDEAILDPTGAPARRMKLDQAGKTIALKVGDTVEDSLTVVNPTERYHVAVVMPFAAGMEPLNPDLKTAPPEATPSAEPTLKPSYTSMLDDKLVYFYEKLPAGTFSFHVRTKAATPGRFIQPPAFAQMMYDDAVNANGAGAVVVIAPAP